LNNLNRILNLDATRRVFISLSHVTEMILPISQKPQSMRRTEYIYLPTPDASVSRSDVLDTFNQAMVYHWMRSSIKIIKKRQKLNVDFFFNRFTLISLLTNLILRIANWHQSTNNYKYNLWNRTINELTKCDKG